MNTKDPQKRRNGGKEERVMEEEAIEEKGRRYLKSSTCKDKQSKETMLEEQGK